MSNNAKLKNSQEIRDKSVALAKGTYKAPGWLDVFEKGLEYSLDGRTMEEESDLLKEFERQLENNPQEEVVAELCNLTRRLIADIKTNTLASTQKMGIAIDCAKELKSLSMPRLTTQKVDEDPKKNRPMVTRSMEGYLPEGTEDD